MIKLYAENLDKIVVIHIKGSFNVENLNVVEAFWMDQVENLPEVIAIDCRYLDSVDSSAIGTIVKFFNHAMKKRILLVFYDLSPIIQKLFATAKLNKFFTITSRNGFESQYAISPAARAGESIRIL